MTEKYFLTTKTEIENALTDVVSRLKCGGVDCTECIFGLKNCKIIKRMIDELKEGEKKDGSLD